MIKTTQRDLELIKTLDTLKVMTSKQIQRLFFHNNQGHQSRRCKQLVNHKKIKCSSLGAWEQNVYYLKRKPRQQIKSMLLLSEFYVLLQENNFEIIEFQREYNIPNTKIRADAYMSCVKNNLEYNFIIEVDLTHFNGYKYELELLKGYNFPELISISPYKRKYPKELKVYHIDKDFYNIKKFLNNF